MFEEKTAFAFAILQKRRLFFIESTETQSIHTGDVKQKKTKNSLSGRPVFRRGGRSMICHYLKERTIYALSKSQPMMLPVRREATGSKPQASVRRALTRM